MTDRQTGETRETRERKRQKKEKIPTCLGLNRQSISVEPGEKAGIADGNGTAQKAKDEKERKKERLNSWSIYIIIPFWFSFFSNMEVKESIVMGIRRNTKHRIPTQAPVWRYAKFFLDLALLLCVSAFRCSVPFLGPVLPFTTDQTVTAL